MTKTALHLGYTGNPLDRADHMRRDAAAVQAARMNPDARFLILKDLQPLMREDKSDLYWARRSEVPSGVSILLGLDADGAPRFAVDGTPDDDIPGVPTDARVAGTLLGDGRAAIVAQARSVLDWHRRHGFCAACGSPTRLDRAGYSRLCEGCGAEHFPRVDPVVIMLAEKDGKALVGRGPRFPVGFMSALAGFVEPGESLEEAVARELYEEAGIRVHSVRLGASQPWPFPSSLMMGAFATADSFELNLDVTEISEAIWVSREEVRAVLRGEGAWTAPPPLAIAHWLLATWADSGE
ncbi:NAD(+) diphosphatase [Sandaracinobacteroides hominis]|uniref:NAD(+) diphosphatase n=1 Tax=Sandaracinobacteroides hominis TaxID=2780086 RepID=UPI0018F534B6|nr:NAD(+) diphosphatase [Sandaracinobacteroides hominis]